MTQDTQSPIENTQGLTRVTGLTHYPDALGLGTPAADRLNDYLRGYGRNQVHKLAQLANLTGWEAAAAQVLQSRRFSLLSAFDDELLTFIQQGHINVQEAALAVAHDLKSNTSAGGAHD